MTVKMNGRFEGFDWSCEFNSSGPGSMNFSLDREKLLRSNGVDLGLLKERHGIQEICRSHYSEKTDWSWVESKTMHPFGSEPIIKRKWKQAANHIGVVTDVNIRGALPLNYIAVDSLSLLGKWQKVLIYYQSPGELEIKLQEFDLSNFDGMKQFNPVPIVMLFVADDGVELEIGTGHDLWRWYSFAARFNGRTEFILKKTDQGLSLERKILVLDEELEMGKNNFRFNWYFAWGKNIKSRARNFADFNTLKIFGNKLFSDTKSKNFVYCLAETNWPDTALAGGTSGKYPCFCSRQTSNYLRQWFRSLFSGIMNEKIEIIFCNVEPRACNNSAHLSGKKEKPVHWDYLYIIGFWEWVSKYLSGSEIRFSILPPRNSIFANLPSFKGLEARNNEET